LLKNRQLQSDILTKKFDDEPKIKRKQQRQSVTGDFKTEKKQNMKVVNIILKRKQGELNIDKAVNQNIANEQKKKRKEEQNNILHSESYLSLM